MLRSETREEKMGAILLTIINMSDLLWKITQRARGRAEDDGIETRSFQT